MLLALDHFPKHAFGGVTVTLNVSPAYGQKQELNIEVTDIYAMKSRLMRFATNAFSPPINISSRTSTCQRNKRHCKWEVRVVIQAS